MDVIAYSKAGDRIKYAGDISMSHDRQMNISLLKSNSTKVLEERRRYFKIKVELPGRALFVVRDENTIRFEEPVAVVIHDINVGGIFLTSAYEFHKDDSACVDIELVDGYHLGYHTQSADRQRRRDHRLRLRIRGAHRRTGGRYRQIHKLCAAPYARKAGRAGLTHFHTARRYRVR